MEPTRRGLVALVVLVGAIGCDTSTPTPPATAARSSPSPADRPTLPSASAPRRPGADGLREVTFDDIKLDMQKGDPFTPDLLPERVRALDGERIRIRGYIFPTFQQTGLTQFVLVRDNLECCFGPGAALHDCIVVQMLPDRTADYSIRPVAVAGTFRLHEFRGPDGRHLAIYALDGEEVR